MLDIRHISQSHRHVGGCNPLLRNREGTFPSILRYTDESTHHDNPPLLLVENRRVSLGTNGLKLVVLMKLVAVAFHWCSRGLQQEQQRLVCPNNHAQANKDKSYIPPRQSMDSQMRLMKQLVRQCLLVADSLGRHMLGHLQPLGHLYHCAYNCRNRRPTLRSWILGVNHHMTAGGRASVGLVEVYGGLALGSQHIPSHMAGLGE
jgi:hypothetical protein